MENKDPNYIYKVTSPSGGIYIGITKHLRWRKNQHKSEKGSALYPVIRKYGWEGLDVEVLCTALTREYAYELEIEFIKKYDSYNNGYNRSIGGEGRKIEMFKDDDHVREIAESIKEGVLGYTEIAKKYSVSKWAVMELSGGRLRIDITGGKIKRLRDPVGGSNQWSSIFKEADVTKIKERLRDGETSKEIAASLDCSPSTVHNIRIGVTWKHVKVKGFIPKKVISNRICKKKRKLIEEELIHGTEVYKVAEKHDIKYHTCYRYYMLLIRSGDIKKEE